MKTIPVFYCPEMSVQTESYSPSANKPRQVVDDWLTKDLPVTVIRPDPIDQFSLEKAHAPKYVQAVLAGQEVNGFGNKDLQVADSLKYTTGAMYEAAYLALTNKQVACAPVSGFHHAHYTFGGGFCTFNGLMATLYKLRDRGLIQRAAILDLDMHYGDGTEDIIEILGSGSWVKQYSKSFYPRQAETFLAALPSIIEQWADSENRPDIILYQAGADSHVDDPLGGYLTTEQMRRRDRIVFETCKRVGIPVAWNLAGGYQRDADGSIEPVLELHRATMEECAAVFTA